MTNLDEPITVEDIYGPSDSPAVKRLIRLLKATLVMVVVSAVWLAYEGLTL